VSLAVLFEGSGSVAYETADAVSVAVPLSLQKTKHGG